MDLDISNDPQIERLGANATALHALEFWNRLSAAARKDARLFDPLWGDEVEVEKTSTYSCGVTDCKHTKEILLTGSKDKDNRLYQRFRSNFGGLNVLEFRVDNPTGIDDDMIQVTSSRGNNMNPLGGERWQTLLLASEGNVKDFNFMTLLRAHAHDIFWMTEGEVCDGLVVVPRAQFIFIELARMREGFYGSKFRKALEIFDLKTQSDVLSDYLSSISVDPGHNDGTTKAIDALDTMQNQWPNPSNFALKQTGVVKLLRRGMHSSSIDSQVATRCEQLLRFWQDIKQLAKIPKQLDSTNATVARAADALLSKALGKSCEVSPDATTHQVEPLPQCSLKDIMVTPDCNPDESARIFRQHGILLIKDMVQPEVLKDCQNQAQQALHALVTEQLEPRGLQVDGAEDFDFAEVRQRPGHRVDNRYNILDVNSSPIASLSQRLLEALPSMWKDDGYKLCYGGVVHSFPRKNEEDKIPPAQIWHRDGPSLFFTNPHETHCFNVFIPLVDVTTENGTTELVPGTHVDTVYEEVALEVIPLAQRDPAAQHTRALRAEVPAGSVLVFDIRVLHRGLANASMKDRPMLYFTMGKEWFEEKHMFSNASLRESTGARANRRLVSQAYSMITGLKDDFVEKSRPPQNVGHPHYTSRFDWLLLEQFGHNDAKEESKATQNLAATMSFGLSPDIDKNAILNEFFSCLTDEANVKRKLDTLQSAQVARRNARKNVELEDEDFASITKDMSDIATLYSLTATIVLQESALLSKLEFSVDREGLLTLLALLKAYSSHVNDKSGIPSMGILEESFTSWWHAGRGRFSLSSNVEGESEAIQRDESDLSKRKLLVVFSSLGTGIARPEWNGSLRDVVSKTSDLDVLHVLDPAFSWYCQDPTCSWTGGDYYFEELRRRLQPYQSVMFLGDSMGAAAALRFSELADQILAFTPQVDISTYEAITRLDFPLSVKSNFTKQLIDSVGKTDAVISVHYGKKCEEDVRQIKLLPTALENIRLVEYDYDDHILSLHLRDQGKLTGIVETAVQTFASG